MPAVSAEPLFGYPQANLAILSQQGFTVQQRTTLLGLDGLELTIDHYLDRAWVAEPKVLNLNTANFFTPTGVPVAEKPAVAYWISLDASVVWILSCRSELLGNQLAWAPLTLSTQRGMRRADPGTPKMSDCTSFANFGGWSQVRAVTTNALGINFVLAATFTHKTRGKEMLMMQCQQLPDSIASAFGR